jgi:hypothetical protein
MAILALWRATVHNHANRTQAGHARMARKIKTTIDNRTTRLALTVRRKPYSFTTVAPGVALGFRRNRTINAWVVRCADGHGGAWTSTLPGAPDDFEGADGDLRPSPSS